MTVNKHSLLPVHLRMSRRLWMGIFWMGLAAGCGSGETSNAIPDTLVLADVKTGMVFTAPPETAIPAKHPQTGKPTLLRAWYCPRCRTWHPVPPSEVLQRNAKAGKCPKTGVALQPTGPLPANAIALDVSP